MNIQKKELGGRRKSILGLSAGSWISLGALAVTITIGAIAYGAQQNQVKTNTEDIKEVRTEVREQLTELKTDLTNRINESELRTRSGIQENRQMNRQILILLQERNGS